MKGSSPSGTASDIFHARAAGGLAACALVALLVVLIFNAFDRRRRSQLETFEEVTAVGDKAWFRMPETATQKPPPAATVFGGKELYPVSYLPVKIRDTKMIRAGEGDAGKLRIYTSREPIPPQEGEAEKPGTPFYFLKIDSDEYIKVRASTPGM